MEKLTLKHLAPYLPYGLKVKDKNKIYILVGTQGKLNQIGIDYVVWAQLMPLLIPLAEIDNSFIDESDYFDKSSLINAVLRMDCKVDLFNTLVELHFDVFGLIDSGLAIPKLKR